MLGSGGEVYQATFQAAEGGILEKSLEVIIFRRHVLQQSVGEKGKSVLLLRELGQVGNK
jgi:hypothetical protein